MRKFTLIILTLFLVLAVVTTVGCSNERHKEAFVGDWVDINNPNSTMIIEQTGENDFSVRRFLGSELISEFPATFHKKGQIVHELGYASERILYYEEETDQIVIGILRYNRK